MQFLEHWDPLSLPRGSVRAIIALALLGLLSYFLLDAREVPLSLAFVSLLVLGHYFGARAGRSEYQGRPPLFLPRGSIRILIIGLILTVTWFLWEDGRLFPLNATDRETVVVLVALGLIVGYLVRAALDLVTRGRMGKPRRLFENVKAILALMATATLVIACASDREESETLALVATPFIAFYFGSRQGWQNVPPAARVEPIPPAPREPEPALQPPVATPAEPPTVKAEPSASAEA